LAEVGEECQVRATDETKEEGQEPERWPPDLVGLDQFGDGTGHATDVSADARGWGSRNTAWESGVAGKRHICLLGIFGDAYYAVAERAWVKVREAARA
jgi:hypothetical protein